MVRVSVRGIRGFWGCFSVQVWARGARGRQSELDNAFWEVGTVPTALIASVMSRDRR